MNLLSVSVRRLAVLVVSCPLLAATLCVTIAATYHGTLSTRTHCNVPNPLPSISAAIGDYTPECYIWRTLIALHCLPRIAAAFVYYTYYSNTLRRPGTLARVAQYAACVLHCAENLSLLGMSYVSSRENFTFHEAMFIVFVSTSIGYMVATLYLARTIMATNYVRVSADERRAMRYKQWAFLVNITSFTLALYFYWRHNTRCEPYIYSLFALCEYLVVLSNMAFHFTFYWDFPEPYALHVTDLCVLHELHQRGDHCCRVG